MAIAETHNEKKRLPGCLGHAMSGVFHSVLDQPTPALKRDEGRGDNRLVFHVIDGRLYARNFPRVFFTCRPFLTGPINGHVLNTLTWQQIVPFFFVASLEISSGESIAPFTEWSREVFNVAIRHRDGIV